MHINLFALIQLFVSIYIYIYLKRKKYIYIYIVYTLKFYVLKPSILYKHFQ